MRWTITKNKTVAVILSVWTTVYGVEARAALWSRVPGAFTESDVLAVAISAEGELILGTKNALYIREKTDPDQQWRQVLGLTENIDGIADITAGRRPGRDILAADKNAVYQITSSTTVRIFSLKDRDNEQCLSVLNSSRRFYVGTTKGLYCRTAGQDNWQRVLDIGENPVVRIRQGGGFIYAAAGARLYRMNEDGTALMPVFRVFGAGEDDTGGDDHGGLLSFPIKDVRIDGTGGAVYLAAQTGIYTSPDQGQNWQRIETRGLPLKDIRSLALIAPAREPGAAPVLVAATTQGAFLQNGGSWIPLYQGLETGRINDLTVGVDGILYAATDKGAFALKDVLSESQSAQAVSISYYEAQKRFAGEPTIREVQKLAIEYAEVDNSKIKNWRRLARQKAWLPSLSMGLDNDRNVTVSDSVYGSYSSGGQSYVGPDDKTGYSNFGFDVSLSWDLADLVWSTDQTTIDSRAKMMVELREDILNQVTRLYFERRRLQIELINGAAGGAAPGALEKHMRIEELTALIDAMTGGGFSERKTAGQPREGSPEQQAVSFN